MIMKKLFLITILSISFILISGCNQDKAKEKAKISIKSTPKKKVEKNLNFKFPDAKVTFIELGSVRCIPCKKMQKVIKSVEKKYGDQINTVFYDVWTPEGEPYAAAYKIDLIPTQVFLDDAGVEFYRHQGFFPEEELIKILKRKGVN